MAGNVNLARLIRPLGLFNKGRTEPSASEFKIAIAAE